MKEYAFGIDLGGTTAKVGLFTTSGALLEKWEVPTDTSNAGEHILENLADAIHGFYFCQVARTEFSFCSVPKYGV